MFVADSRISDTNSVTAGFSSCSETDLGSEICFSEIFTLGFNDLILSGLDSDDSFGDTKINQYCNFNKLSLDGLTTTS